MVYIFLTLVFWKGAGKEKELVMNLLCYKYQHVLVFFLFWNDLMSDLHYLGFSPENLL